MTATVLSGTAGEVLLVVTAGSRLSQYVAMNAGSADFVRMWLDASQRLVWLESYASDHRDTADGVDLSFGQWQKVALARGFMRDGTLLQVLDEPTAALDAETEHALFESFARQAREGTTEGGAGGRGERGGRARRGRITILVSHRFSTVRMADLILVLQGSRLVEVGSHEELMAAGGTYAELYTLQAKAYR
ncbi:hypothetical protein [Actinopolymorpha sp. B9G3]|uniref:hypothetical protein n=1 Tax=unclassified Actinopolymorpha TaxID=2627063 RepID=UPI0032D8F9ED